MKKIISLLFVMLFAVGAMVGCSNSTTESNSKDTKQATTQTFPVTIKDASGDKVTIKAEPKKIVSLMPSNTETAFALGLGDKIVGVTQNDNYPKETKDIPKVGDMKVNVEKVIALKPDLVLAHTMNMSLNGSDSIKQLKQAGITVLVVNDAESFKQTYDSIEMIGKATGKTEAAVTLVNDMKAKIKDIQEKAKSVKADERKKVLIEVQSTPDIYVAGKHTFMDEMLQIINADNVAGKLESWAKVDGEAMVAANPDIIITTSGQYNKDVKNLVLKRSGWEDVSAIKNKQVYDVDSDTLTRSGPRLVKGVEELAKAVYPNVFNK